MKPKYSKRRLKKLGVEMREEGDNVNISINTSGGSFERMSRFHNSIKKLGKTIIVRTDGMQCSVGVLLHNMTNKYYSSIPTNNLRSQYGNFRNNFS